MEQDVIKFIKGYDFMRLGQAISHQQWQAAAMIIRRMEMQAKKPELENRTLLEELVEAACRIQENEKELQKLTDAKIELIEKVGAAKEKEIMEV